MPEAWDRRARTVGRALLNYRGARAATIRRLLFAALGKGTDLIVAPFGKGRMLVDARDREVGAVVFATGGYERLYMATALETLERFGLRRPGSIFVDIGANIGTSTIDALLHFGFGRAQCFEPDPDNCRLLRINLILNGLEERALVHQCAASDAEGHALLRRSHDNRGDNRLVSHAASAGSQAPAPDLLVVECRRFDSLTGDGTLSLEDVGLVWIDVQGHEGSVLAGASRVTQLGLPTVVEYCPGLLEQSGRRWLFEAIVGECYTTVVDLRLAASGLGSRSVFAARDVARIGRSLGARDHTDLLLLRDDHG